MVKKIFKGIGFIAFLLGVATISYFTSYYVTTKANDSAKATETPSYTVFADDKPKARIKKEGNTAFEYYIVRLEGNSLNVYTCADNSEEFLYSEEILTSNLTKTDIEFLEQGTVLYTTGQLTRFMENFIS